MLFPWAVEGFNEIAFETFPMQSWLSIHVNFHKGHFWGAMFWGEIQNLILLLLYIFPTLYFCTKEKFLLLFTTGPLTSPLGSFAFCPHQDWAASDDYKRMLGTAQSGRILEELLPSMLSGCVFQRHILFQAPVYFPAASSSSSLHLPVLRGVSVPCTPLIL